MERKNRLCIYRIWYSFHRLDDFARGGIITEIEIKNIKELVEILQSRNYKLNRNEGTYNGKIKNRI